MILAATQAHAAALAQIHAAAFPAGPVWTEDFFAAQLGLPGGFGLLHPDGAMLLARCIADEAEILTLATVPGARRRGLASVLLRQAQTRAATLFLEVSETNPAARGLYARLGFHQIGRRRAYYEDGADALVLRYEAGSTSP